MDWQGPLFWAVLGLAGGWIIARHYYKKAGSDLIKLQDAIIQKIDTSAEISNEVKSAIKAEMEGIFYSYPWGKGYVRETLGGGPGRQKLGG
jgi:hypothetical protein